MDSAPYSCETFVGRLAVWSKDKTVTRVGFIDEDEPWRKPSNQTERAIISKFLHYFDNPRYLIKGVRLLPAPTDMQAAFRALLRATSVGELLSYATVAHLLGTSPRAVGGLCASNIYPIIIPCHRIIAKDGLGGYTGPYGADKNLAIKRRLIDHERII